MNRVWLLPLLFLLFFSHCIATTPTDHQLVPFQQSQQTNQFFVLTVDGTLHCIENYHVEWNITIGKPFLQNNITSSQNHVLIIPSMNGNLYKWNSNSLSQYPITLKQLIEWSPYLSSDSSTLYLSQKYTSTVNIDLLSHKKQQEISLQEAQYHSKLEFIRVDYHVESVQKSSLSNNNWRLWHSELILIHQPQIDDRLVFFVNENHVLYLNGVPIESFRSHPIAIYSFVNTTSNQLQQHTLQHVTLQHSPHMVYLSREDEHLIYALESSLTHPSTNTILDTQIPIANIHDQDDDDDEYNRYYRVQEFERLETCIHFNYRLDYNNKLLLTMEAKTATTTSTTTNITWSMVILFFFIPALVGIIYVLSKKKNNQQSQPAMQQPTIQQSPISDVLKIGQLTIFKNKVIGHGSNGTVVYEGLLGTHRKCAVKRMLKEYLKYAEREMEMLIKSDRHAHIVRYYSQETDDTFVFLALEYCDYNLEHYLQQHQVSLDCRREWIVQLCRAIHHLHELKIVHRDLKPQNVLLKETEIKLSDMGLSKYSNSKNSTMNFVGTNGWTDPYILQCISNHSHEYHNNPKIDIYGIGLLTWYIYMGGKPLPTVGWQQQWQREEVMKKLMAVECSEAALASDFICWCLEWEPDKRPTTEQLLQHPFLWSFTKKTDFLCEVSDQLAKEGPQNETYQELEKRGSTTLWSPCTSWDQKLKPTLLKQIAKFRNYNFKNVWDLLRLFRNIRTHFNEYDEAVVRTYFGGPQKIIKDGGLYLYFDEQFPQLFTITFEVVKQANWFSHLKQFQKYQNHE